ASGEHYDPAQFTAAHRTLPFGSLVRVTNPRNGQQVTVRINDRGPFGHGRVIDLSRAAAEELDLVRAGVGEVELELLAE
ncbi:MAG: septal ring lytic transglycosylase RlpA family protein, partial [Erythrobacter sp.]